MNDVVQAKQATAGIPATHAITGSPRVWTHSRLDETPGPPLEQETPRRQRRKPGSTEIAPYFAARVIKPFRDASVDTAHNGKQPRRRFPLRGTSPCRWQKSESGCAQLQLCSGNLQRCFPLSFFLGLRRLIRLGGSTAGPSQRAYLFTALKTNQPPATKPKTSRPAMAAK